MLTPACNVQQGSCGERLTKAECDRRGRSQYRVQIHKNFFLDAADAKHFEGRYINDARNSKYKTNARFAAGYVTNKCSVTGFYWVRIYATCNIKAGDEIFIDYGEDFWANLEQSISSTSSCMWAAPAPIPDLSSELHHPQHDITDNNNTNATPTTTMIWPTQVPPHTHTCAHTHTHMRTHTYNTKIDR